MTDLERLDRLGAHLDQERHARQHTSRVETTVVATWAESGAGASRFGRRLLTGAAALVVVATVVAVGGELRDADTDVASTSSDLPTAVEVPVGAPVPGSVVPYVAAPPPWFGDPIAGWRDGAHRTGRWTSTAIGTELDGRRVGSPVWVGVTDGSLRVLAESETVVVDGVEYQSVRQGEWQTLASRGTLTLVASGAVDTETLASVIRGARVSDTAGALSVQIDELPAGYTEVVAPQEHARDTADRRTLAGANMQISVNEVSDWVDPELAAAASGADYEPLTVGDFEAWTGITEFNPFGTMRFLLWSPEPGVVLEITTTDLERPIADLVNLGQTTQLLTSSEWDNIVPGR